MSELTLDDLRGILAEAAGADQAAHSAVDFADATFDDLGYDSLVFLETLSRISLERDVFIPDVDVNDYKTPRELLDFVNEFLRTATASASAEGPR